MAQSSYASETTVTQEAARSPSSRAEPTTAVAIQAVSHRYGDLEVLRDVSLEVAAGEVTGIVGPSGCGKSTLLSLIAGLEPPTSGTVTAADGALMPQRDLVMPWRDALGNASIALENAGRGPHGAPASARGSCSPASISSSSSARAAGSFPAGCASASRSCAPCWPKSRCCCWTSRSPRSMPSPGSSCRTGWSTPSRRSRARS